MKYIFPALFAVFFLGSCGNTAKLISDADRLLKESSSSGLTEREAADGLKEALSVGVDNGVAFLSARDGFFKNNAYKIVIPEEAKKMEKTLRNMGLGSQCDQAIESMNRAAELAVAEAKPVFLSAVKNMSISDALKIVTGGNGAATKYLKETTSAELTQVFQPVVMQSLDKVQATRYWGDLANVYNKVPGVTKVNPDLADYVTGKAMEALFSQMTIEENKIRQDPLKRGTDLLKKVFGFADTHKP